MTLAQVAINAAVTIICAFIIGLPAIILARKGMMARQESMLARQEGIIAQQEVAMSIAQSTSIKADKVLEGNDRIHTLVNSGSDKMKIEISELKLELQRANDRVGQLTDTVNGLLVRILNPSQKQTLKGIRRKVS